MWPRSRAASSFCANPLQVVDAGFALTFGATLGILIGMSKFSKRVMLSGWPRAPVTLLPASACAEIALLPVSAFVFSRITFAGLIVNFAAIPLMTIVQIARHGGGRRFNVFSRRAAVDRLGCASRRGRADWKRRDRRLDAVAHATAGASFDLGRRAYYAALSIACIRAGSRSAPLGGRSRRLWPSSRAVCGFVISPPRPGTPRLCA